MSESGEVKISRHIVWEDGVYVRAGHSLNADILKKYNATKRVEVIIGSNIFEDGEEWVKIKYEDSESGEAWIAYKYLLPDRDIVITADMLPKEIVVKIDKVGDLIDSEQDARDKKHVIQENWGAPGKGEYTEKPLTSMYDRERYNIAVGPKILNPKYPDDEKVEDDDFKAFTRYLEVLIEDKETSDKKTLYCYRKDIKAHTYTHYPDGHKYGSESGIKVTVFDKNKKGLKNGYVQTGIRYPNAAISPEWAPNTVSGNVIEFCSDHTGDLDCSKYRLVSITVHLEEEGKNVEEDI